MTLKHQERAKNYLANMRRDRLRPEVASVISSIEKQFREKGYVTERQLDVLKRCCLATNPKSGGSLHYWKAWYQGYRG